MMALLRFLAPALAAALAAACGASSVSDFSAGAPQLAAAPVQAPAAKGGGGPAQAADSSQTAALQKVAQTYTAMADPKTRAYKIGPLDVLEVSVFKVPDLSKTVQVSEAGTINFPLIGEVEASGKSARELEQLLTKELGAKYLQKPQISVFVKEHNSQRVTVEGAVKKPGVVPMAGGMSLLQAVAISGGTDETAENTAVVFRMTEGKRFAAKYDLSDIRAGRADDPQLQSGDVVIVPTSDLKFGLNTVLRLLPLATVVPLL
ncbi:MAG: polysaccharide biosynthesis/export family protein [Rhodomicrobium sp.]